MRGNGTDRPLELSRLLRSLEPQDPRTLAARWLRSLRERLAADPDDETARAALESQRFAELCRWLAIDPNDARRRLLRSVGGAGAVMTSPDLMEDRDPSPRTPPAASPRARILLAFSLVLLGGALMYLLPVRDWLLAALTWTRGLGPAGALVFVPVYLAATVLLVPGSLLTIGAGFLFGLVRGTILVSIGSTLGAAAAFLLGRTLARGWVEARLAGSPRFAAIDRAVGREGFKIVLLTRLSPVFPFVLQNYAFGLTGISFGRYLLASWIGMIPGTVLYVYLGTAAQSLAELAAGGAGGGMARRLLLVAGLAATAAVTVTVTRIARRALAEAIGEVD